MDWNVSLPSPHKIRQILREAEQQAPTFTCYTATQPRASEYLINYACKYDNTHAQVRDRVKYQLVGSKYTLFFQALLNQTNYWERLIEW